MEREKGTGEDGEKGREKGRGKVEGRREER